MKERTHITKIALLIVEEKFTVKGIQNWWINQNHHSGILLLSKQEDYKHHLTMARTKKNTKCYNKNDSRKTKENWTRISTIFKIDKHKNQICNFLVIKNKNMKDYQRLE